MCTEQWRGTWRLAGDPSGLRRRFAIWPRELESRANNGDSHANVTWTRRQKTSAKNIRLVAMRTTGHMGLRLLAGAIPGRKTSIFSQAGGVGDATGSLDQSARRAVRRFAFGELSKIAVEAAQLLSSAVLATLTAERTGALPRRIGYCEEIVSRFVGRQLCRVTARGDLLE